MAEDIGKKLEEQTMESTKKVKAFFAGLDQWTAIAVIAAFVMALFGNFFVFFTVGIGWNFWITLAGAIVIGAMIYLEITQNKMTFKTLPLWMKVAFWVGVYVFVTNLISQIQYWHAMSVLRSLENFKWP